MKFNPRPHMHLIGFPRLYIQPVAYQLSILVSSLCTFTISLLRLQTLTEFLIRAVIGFNSPCFCCLQMSSVQWYSQAPRLEEGQGSNGRVIMDRFVLSITQHIRDARLVIVLAALLVVDSSVPSFLTLRSASMREQCSAAL